MTEPEPELTSKLIETIRDILIDEVGEVGRADALAVQIVREIEQLVSLDSGSAKTTKISNAKK
jgi:hypothetical protein